MERKLIGCQRQITCGFAFFPLQFYNEEFYYKLATIDHESFEPRMHLDTQFQGIFAEGKQHPLAVGITKMSTDDM